MDVSEIGIGGLLYIRYIGGVWHRVVAIRNHTEYHRIEARTLVDALDEIERLHQVIQTYSDQYER